MNILGKDCGCEARKRDSGSDNPFWYWLVYRPQREARKLLYRALSSWASLKPLVRPLLMGEHITMAEGHLTARVTRADGSIEDLDLGYNTIPTTAVNFLASDFNAGATDASTFKYHAWGTGGGGATPACGQAALTTPAAPTTVTAVTGDQANPTANTYRTIGTITAGGTLAIAEWILLNQDTISGATSWSIKGFATINLSASDSIQFTYTLTIACVTG